MKLEHFRIPDVKMNSKWIMVPLLQQIYKTLEKKIYNRKESENKYLYMNHFVVHMKLA